MTSQNTANDSALEISVWLEINMWSEHCVDGSTAVVSSETCSKSPAKRVGPSLCRYCLKQCYQHAVLVSRAEQTEAKMCF